MARWDEVRAWARKNFQLDRDDPTEFALTVARHAGAPREQRVLVRTYAAWDQAMIEFRSAFGELDADHDPAEVLREALTLPFGGIALHGRFLVVVHREWLEPLTIEGIVDRLSKLSLLADELEERRGADRF